MSVAHVGRRRGYSPHRVVSRPRAPTDIQREAKKTELSIKECAKRGDKRSMVVLAKELLRSRKAVTRLYTSKAQMNSVTLHLNENLGALPGAQTVLQGVVQGRAP